MSGHSKWASIKHKKAKVDAQRGRAFTKLIREITVAARVGGGDLTGNPRLRTAVLAAKAVNMPADNIDRAIKKGTGELEGVSYEEITYEGYGPGGAAVLAEVMTDNKNRTVGEIRKIFSRHSGNLGESGCVNFLFEKKGHIVVDSTKMDEEKLMSIALDAGAEDLQQEESVFSVITRPKDFDKVRPRYPSSPRARSSWTAKPQSRCSSSWKNWKSTTTCSTSTPISTSPRRSWRRSPPEAGVMRRAGSPRPLPLGFAAGCRVACAS